MQGLGVLRIERNLLARPPQELISERRYRGSTGLLGQLLGPIGAEALEPVLAGGESGGTGLGRAGVERTNMSIWPRY